MCSFEGNVTTFLVEVGFPPEILIQKINTGPNDAPCLFLLCPTEDCLFHNFVFKIIQIK